MLQECSKCHECVQPGCRLLSRIQRCTDGRCTRLWHLYEARLALGAQRRQQRLGIADFQQRLQQPSAMQMKLIVADNTMCISQLHCLHEHRQ